MFCDLHMHSTASDGTDSPEMLPQLAKAAGVNAIALTDHDTTSGLDACAGACGECEIDFVPGIELSIDPGRPMGTLHLLGYFVRQDSEALNGIIKALHESRTSRNPRIVKRLQELGIDITEEEVLGHADGATIGRPHIASILHEKGYVKTIKEAFTRYLGASGAAYTRRDKIQPEDAIAAVHDAGGLAVLAHPVQLRLPSEDAIEQKIASLRDMGLDGVEVMHSDHTPTDVKYFTKLAERLNLMATGGSDYHGTRKTVKLGSQNVPYSIYERLEGARDS